MTLTADSKKRVVLPGAAPGDVFVCERKGPEFVLRRVHRAAPLKKRTKAEVFEDDTKLEECPEHSLGEPAEDHAGTMILLDTNVIIDAHYGVGNDRVHAKNLISSSVNAPPQPK